MVSKIQEDVPPVGRGLWSAPLNDTTPFLEDEHEGFRLLLAPQPLFPSMTTTAQAANPVKLCFYKKPCTFDFLKGTQELIVFSHSVQPLVNSTTVRYEIYYEQSE